MRQLFLLICILFGSVQPFLPAQDSAEEVFEVAEPVTGLLERRKDKSRTTDYAYNPYVPIELWAQLKPYFLPINHPIKKKLDQLFHGERVTLSEETFVGAGFSITRRNRPFNAIVTGHKDLKGYLVKVYLDSQFAVSDWYMWLNRIKGVEVIQACLKKHGFTRFALPRKWIYPLPAEPSPPSNGLYNRKNFILVVEDMHILNHQDNAKAYKLKMTRSLLNDLYTVLMECQLTDCIYIGNMPFTKEGKIAFVDTERYFNGEPDFNQLKRYLSVPMQAHLDKLIQKGIPQD
ncbi:hypothetical protein [Candidatus Protochlamydia phocaeensis]|uniref:hypothetical protein n=1 Tax=Candidatus Protochlamydia phocaeensis TaxID=1414722 RepID=UPI0012ABAA8F|nr:hypothetical protein [Candidatus Protochlamydia phocaeensis]